jgi:hypothetical protein
VATAGIPGQGRVWIQDTRFDQNDRAEMAG